jgi:hypothetical protein
MTALDNVHPAQFAKTKPHTMSMASVGKLRSGDYGTSMDEMAGNDEARWSMDQGSNKYAGTGAMEDLTDSIASHGVKEPIEIWGSGRHEPVVSQGHHRFQASYDLGLSRIPVSGSVKAAKAATVYTAP